MNLRYQRHIQLDEIGAEGQQKLAIASVLVIGAGGLGCPILQYLAAAGVGVIGIVDHDNVDITNLQRQILYTEDDVGKPKVACAKKRLQALDSEIQINAYNEALTNDNYERIISNYDIVIDGTDNFETRYLINDACVLLNKPFVFGAIYKFEGQVSVLNYQNGPTYRCLFPNPPKAGEVPSCNEIGVLGVLPGIIGMFQAVEALKMILNLKTVLSGKMLYYNVLSHQQNIISFPRNGAIISAVISNGKPFQITTDLKCEPVESISLAEIENSEAITWIDVREERELPKIEAENIFQKPLKTIDFSEAIFSNSKRKIFFCQSGVRSKQAVQKANEKDVTNCFSLQEGATILKEWIIENYG